MWPNPLRFLHLPFNHSTFHSYTFTTHTMFVKHFHYFHYPFSFPNRFFSSNSFLLPVCLDLWLSFNTQFSLALMSVVQLFQHAVPSSFLYIPSSFSIYALGIPPLPSLHCTAVFSRVIFNNLMKHRIEPRYIDWCTSSILSPFSLIAHSILTFSSYPSGQSKSTTSLLFISNTITLLLLIFTLKLHFLHTVKRI